MPIMSNAEFDEVDSLMEEAHAKRTELDGQLANIQMMGQNGKMIPPRERAMYKVLHAERQKLDKAIQGMLNSPYAPPGYMEHYNTKYATPQPETPAQESKPGFFDNMLDLGGRVVKGIGDTAKFAIQNPGSALRHIEQGKNELVSLPFRALEGAIGRDKLPDWISPNKGLERQQQDVAARDQAEGIDPRGTGPVVAETVGQMAVPVPLPKFLRPEGAPAILSAESAKNALKGGAVASAYHAAERVANEEPVLDESLGAAGGVGAALSVLLGRLGRVAEGKPSRGTPNAPEDIPKPKPSGPPPQLEHKPAMVTPPPPSRLEASKPVDRSRFQTHMESIKSKTQTGTPLSPDEEAFALWHQKNKGTAPPNAGGTRDMTGPVPTREVPVSSLEGTLRPKPLEMGGPKPTNAPQSAQERAMWNRVAAGSPQEAAAKRAPLESVLKGERTAPPPPPKPGPSMASAAEGIEAEKASRVASGRTPDNIKPLTPKQTQAIPPDKIIDTVGKVEKEMDDAAKEVLLSKVLKGEVKAKDVPLKRSPKGEAPAPAVKGEVGAFEPVTGKPIEASRDMGSYKGQKFWAGVYDLRDGTIKEVYPYAHAKGHDFHHQKYLSREEVSNIDAGNSGMFWFEKDGKIGSWEASEQGIPKEILAKIQAQLDKPGAPVPKGSAQSSAKIGVASAAAQKPVENVAKTARPVSTVGAGEAQIGKPSQAPAKQAEPLKTPTKAPAKTQRVEDYIKEQGYKIETKEPFPGEKSYNVIDPKTGLTIARGDRENIVHGLNARNEGKGIKLTSGVDPTDVGKMLKERLGILPKDVEITNSPHKEGPINMALRSAGLETPQFAMRKNEAGRRVVDAALDAEDLRQTRINNLFHEPQLDGSYKDTKLFGYFGASAKDRQAVNDALVVGDRIGATFTREQLARQGLSDNQIKMYEGVREGLDKVKGWIKTIGGHEEFDPKLEGYIPRVWSGDLELFVNGTKHVPLKDGREIGSSFPTLRDAAKEIWKIKQADPTAKIEAKFFSDPNFLMHRGMADGRAVARAKANIESIGKLTDAEVENAFKISKGYKDFSKHLLERKDAKGYETEDLERVLFSYFHKAAKTVETKRMRDAVHQIMKDHGSTLSSSQVKYLESYVDRVAGKPAWDQMAVDTFIRETSIGKWIDPVKAGGLIKTGRDWITYKSLGFGNVSWAMVNLDSLSRHVWPMLQNEAKGMGNKFASEKYLGKAIKEFFNNKALRQKLAHNNVIDIQMMSEHRPQIGAHLGKAQVTPGQIIMYLGTATEEFTRGVAAIARYRMALDQGLADGEAMRVASRFVAETVGRYSKAGKPPAFTGLTGSTVGMFKTYPVVMMQNMFKAFESKDLGVITRYMLAATGVGGLIGAVPGSEQVDKMVTKFSGKSPIKWAEENIPEGILTGIMSVAPDPFKMDLSRKAGLPDVLPQDTKDWLGPVWNTYAQAIADIWNGEYDEAAKDLIPTSIRNILAVSQKPGYVMGRYDKPAAELKPGDAERIKRGLGFQHPDEVRAYRDYGYLHELNNYTQGELRNLSRKIYKGTATPEERQEFYRMGGTNRRIREEARRENSTLRQRQERHLPRVLRGQAPASE